MPVWERYCGKHAQLEDVHRFTHSLQYKVSTGNTKPQQTRRDASLRGVAASHEGHEGCDASRPFPARQGQGSVLNILRSP